ncbi:MAG: metallophosphoesterase [Sphingobacteriales bacterium]|nr:metallophosphoesterase [Sphingobacteriales bacterium]
MRHSRFWWVIVIFMLLLDFYFFQALRTVTSTANDNTRIIIYTAYWGISVTALTFLLLLPYLHFERQAKIIRTTIFSVFAGLFFAKVVGSLFFVADDLRRSVQWLGAELFSSKATLNEMLASGTLSRSMLLSWMGLVAGGGLFGSLVYGFNNKYRYDVKRIRLAFDKLPKAFKGLKIVHISDIHSGSLANKVAVQKGVERILEEKPDLILFTGDLVNNVADEMKDYMDVFNKLSAPMGVYSTLGNHDYGDYVRWENIEQKNANLERLKQIHAELGWQLLMNEHVILERENETIAVLGIENWSAKNRFPKYGDLKKAYTGSEKHAFKILMSHDPSHWKAEVLTEYNDIDLMLAGHTHGMQFGVEIPGLKWSPVQYVYKEWAGLYEKENQKLYVNRGFGFLGYPGRVGILPEITVIELS